jgi:hypothetical protein
MFPDVAFVPAGEMILSVFKVCGPNYGVPPVIKRRAPKAQLKKGRGDPASILCDKLRSQRLGHRHENTNRSNSFSCKRVGSGTRTGTTER